MKKYELVISYSDSTLRMEAIGDDSIRNLIRIAQAINHGKATAHLFESTVQRTQLMQVFDEPGENNA